MNTRLTIGGSVLVLSIVFGFIFWNQFISNQRDLAGGKPQQTTYTIPKNDNINSIEADLSGVNITDIDSDSAQMSTQLNGF